ncbi:hypothetical protein BH11PAT4_BH11PAT4_8940 [soil metagenome]
MNPQSQPTYAANQKIAVSLLVLAGLVFVSFVFFRSNADENSTVINQETNVSSQQTNIAKSEISPTISKESETKGIVITTGNSKFGSMLFDTSGQAIYIWEVEESAAAECYGSCARAWPPVLTDGVPVASGDVKSELLGTTKRTDGTTQVTYNNHPLYYYEDEKAGEVKCHNIRTHGGLWWVVQPNGNRAS